MENLIENLKDFLKPEVIWLIIGILLLIAEFAVPGLIIFFFGVGACITALVCLLTDIGINGQLLIFIISSVVCLIALRRWLKGLFYGHVTSRQEIGESRQCHPTGVQP